MNPLFFSDQRFHCDFFYLADQNPENFNLPTDYTFSENSWGNLFYKIYTTALNYGDAKAQCESDGAFLAIPRSQAENDFLTGLLPNEHIWIGINDIEEEGNFVAVDGREISWTNWHPDEPSPGDGEDGVEIRGWDNGRWNDVDVRTTSKFVCSIHIEGIIFILFEL